MNKAELKNILQSPYNKQRWDATLKFLTRNRTALSLHLEPKIIDLHTAEADKIVKSFSEVGRLKTSDGVTLPVYEVILQDNTRIEFNKVGVNDFIKKFIIKDAVKGALATFAYENDKRDEWRFSFISKNPASDFFAEAESVETNPKKYTYIFGTEDEHRTAIERLYNLEQSLFRLEDFFEAFNVEPVSKKFFEEYKIHHKEISEFLLDSNYFTLFEKKNDENHKPEKEVRNFVSRLMGRIVFLYFLQKKNWLGASNTDYLDGNLNFLSDLFFNDTKNQENFYEKYLCPIFFKALNTPDRENDNFLLENGNTVSIPFLNGGLFEEEQEPQGHRTIKFRKDLFENLFKFFNGYNFTIYENSPEEHTVAVDPEMLGHIFENLIDYNKETGTFYTPKEIVQYMTQESLTEYLVTHLQTDRAEIEQMIRNQTVSNFSDHKLQEIEHLLDDVKICDPAIGSGAFPMGMLQEIFNIKALVAYRLKKEWNPATVKQNIIQNSIYGVDLDEGAVEIARLRFWLSLVVDEGKPKALPNLDYKIMQGNSLVESYKGIDLSKIASGNDLQIVEDLQTDLFGNFVEDQMKMTIGKSGLAEEIQNLTKKFFNAKTTDKQNIKRKIQQKITEHIEFNFELRKNQYIRRISELESVKNLKPNQLKFLEKLKVEFAVLSETQHELQKIQQEDEKPYFLWHLYFKDIFDDGGFDIVIGNPPYIQLQKNNGKLSKVLENEGYQTFVRTGDIYCIFYEKGWRILKPKGILCYITSNKWMRAGYGESTRKFFNENTNPILLIDFAGQKIFESATVDTNILLFSKDKNQKQTKACIIKEKLLNNLSVFISQNYVFSEFKTSESWVILSSIEKQIKDKIERIGKPLKDWDISINYGIKTGYNEAFIIDGKKKDELIAEDPKSAEIIRPILRGRDIKRYGYDFAGLWLINTHNGIKEKGIKPINIEDYPAVKKHLDLYYSQLEKRADKGNTPYNLRNCAYMDDFSKQKIMYSEIVREPQFYLDEKGIFYPEATTFIMSGNNLEYLYNVLHTNIVTYFFKTFYAGGGLGNEGFRYKKAFLEKLPIPLNNKNIEINEDNANDIICKLYELNSSEIEFIENEF
ncbi:Eco57I restriction-modification methylase domain-containing protein [Riemerella anatipestifer]|nr:Eco57I restriction-modification methylase domain-containing protein [Riemerella anatipestifer]